MWRVCGGDKVYALLSMMPACHLFITKSTPSYYQSALENDNNNKLSMHSYWIRISVQSNRELIFNLSLYLIFFFPALYSFFYFYFILTFSSNGKV
jgi:hypothetical protein